jgi:hypothetical protein
VGLVPTQQQKGGVGVGGWGAEMLARRLSLVSFFVIFFTYSQAVVGRVYYTAPVTNVPNSFRFFICYFSWQHGRSYWFFFYVPQEPPVSHGLIIEALRSHSDPPHSVGLLDDWSARRREYLTTQHSQETDVRAPGMIRTRYPNKLAASFSES